jgi:stage III sporulation protein AD
VKATIVLARGYEGTPELTKELQNHVKHTTAPYKYPRIVEYVDELPKTVGGKIKRKMIRQADGVYRLDHAVTATQKTILKAFGISVIAESAADICRDFGESAIGARVELAAKSLIMLLALPVVESLLSLAFGVLE